MKLRLICVIGTLAAVGCGKAAETPTSATSTAPTTILFTGSLDPKATRFYSYTLMTSGTVTTMLASLERNGSPMPNRLEIGLGIPAGTGCAVSAAQNSSSQLIPHLRQDVGIGTYCVRISDIDGLPAPMNFTIRLVHP
jgi:hypothetical protein